MLRQLIVMSALFASPALADYQLALTDIGKRDYYCTITVELTNQTETTLTEINAFFLNYVGDTQVGRSKGASFMNVAPGAVASAMFETPNAPCSATETQVDSYQMVIGACRIDNAFEDKAVCVDAVRLAPPFNSVVPLN
ncbi:hypothetical protein GCM10007385_40230 [Tateyamaria omphalii]|uniref:hypothetical protein n=1 Tax=Tateyamaria omphalii TaxID=299262 RepID=UPI001678C42C|nr:hypothetical protein [Tateyamaria omphalii]GGX67107.1 hypothetical protein GCM10007385_40230 [Tateyamaria omphalii]